MVSPMLSSAFRNAAYASSRVIRLGATTVTFLPAAVMWPGNTNGLQVTDEIQAMRSPSSASGLRFIFTMRLPAGILWQVLTSFSAAGASGDVTGAGPGGGGGGGGATGAGGRGRIIAGRAIGGGTKPPSATPPS